MLKIGILIKHRRFIHDVQQYRESQVPVCAPRKCSYSTKLDAMKHAQDNLSVYDVKTCDTWGSYTVASISPSKVAMIKESSSISLRET